MHDGHRRRLAYKALSDNMLPDHEIIELIICNACPRRNLNGCAHKLLEKFGSVSAVMCAERDELLSVDGVGESIADYIVCLHRCLDGASPSLSFAPIQSCRDFFSLLRLKGKAEKDRVEVYEVDDVGRARKRYVFSAEGEGRVAVKDLKSALNLHRAKCVYAAYIKIFGGNSPEELDDGWCRAVSDACKIAKVQFLDFCIVGGNGEIYSYFMKDRIPHGARIRDIDGI